MKLAIDTFILKPFNNGWDKENGVRTAQHSIDNYRIITYLLSEHSKYICTYNLYAPRVYHSHISQGLYYFLDVDGWSPTQLEWNMKLWWPHNEAMIALLMAYQLTKDQVCLEKFDQVFRYCYKHVKTNLFLTKI